MKPNGYFWERGWYVDSEGVYLCALCTTIEEILTWHPTNASGATCEGCGTVNGWHKDDVVDTLRMRDALERES